MCGRVPESRGGVLAKHLLKVNPTTLSETFLERELLQNMTNKNTYCFATFAAVASLGLGLMISGCGDSGSTDAAQLGKVGQVTFKYDVLAKAAASPKYDTKIKNEIVTVKYAFYGVKDGVRFIESYKDNPSYTHDFKPEANDKDEDVVINNVNDKAAGVIAAYYDKAGNIVAMGEDTIAFTDHKCVIEKPDLATIDTTTIDMDASTYVLSPKGETEIYTTIVGKTAAGVVKVYELTPFVTIEGLDKYTDVLAFNYASNQGLTYKGVGYDGTNKGIVPGKTVKATINGTDYYVDEAIYVTDQHPVDIQVVVDDIDGVVPFVGATNVPLIFADKESLVAGKNIIDMTEAGTATVEHVAVNKLPFEVLAAAYSKEPDKGPQPVLPTGYIDISDFTGLKLVSSLPDVAEVAGLGVTAKKAGSTVISAELKIDETTTIKSDSSKDITVEVLPATENLTFADISGTAKFMENVSAAAATVRDFTMAIYGKVGMTFDAKNYVAAPIEYTAETYPDAEALDASLTDSTYQKIADKNEYKLHVGTVAPTANVPVTVKNATSLKPTFAPIQIEP